MTERHKSVPASYVLLLENGKVLLCRRQNTGYYDGWYNPPSGHIEAGELPKEAMIREAKEEIAVELRPEDLELAHIMYRAKHDETGERVDFFFVSRRWSGDIENREPHKCDDLSWFALDELPNNLEPHVRYAIEAWQRGEVFSEIPFTHEWVWPRSS